jgi:hypothetical protein
MVNLEIRIIHSQGRYLPPDRLDILKAIGFWKKQNSSLKLSPYPWYKKRMMLIQQLLLAGY